MSQKYTKKHQDQWQQANGLARFWQQYRTKIKLILTGAIISMIAAVMTIWFLWEVPLLSPVSSLSQFQFLTSQAKPQEKAKPRIVYGFLPYWNLNKVTVQPELTHLSYFGLNISADGTILTQTEDGTHPGYSKLDSNQLLKLSNRVGDNGDQLDLVLVQFENETIRQIVSNPEAHQNLLTSLDSILLAYPIGGINIDIEYSGEVSDELRADFVNLIRKIDQHLEKKFGGIQLSIDMYASASSEKTIWDVKEIGRYVDYIVVMAYDFHQRSSAQAGPVAPLFGGSKLWSTDIHQHLRNYLKVVPKEKILLGVPFYGYEWQTDSRSPQANTYPDTGSTASYKRVKEILTRQDELQVETHWDDTALCPYLSYLEDDNIYMIYYENPTSISFKLEYVKQLDLAGIAIWALGYEGHTRELWDQVNKRI